MSNGSLLHRVALEPQIANLKTFRPIGTASLTTESPQSQISMFKYQWKAKCKIDLKRNQYTVCVEVSELISLTKLKVIFPP